MLLFRMSLKTIIIVITFNIYIYIFLFQKKKHESKKLNSHIHVISSKMRRGGGEAINTKILQMDNICINKFGVTIYVGILLRDFFFWFDLQIWFDARMTNTWSWIERLYFQFVLLWMNLKLRFDQELWKLNIDDRTWTVSGVMWWAFYGFSGRWIDICSWCLLILLELDEEFQYLRVWLCKELWHFSC